MQVLRQRLKNYSSTLVVIATDEVMKLFNCLAECQDRRLFTLDPSAEKENAHNAVCGTAVLCAGRATSGNAAAHSAICSALKAVVLSRVTVSDAFE